MVGWQLAVDAAALPTDSQCYLYPAACPSMILAVNYLVPVLLAFACCQSRSLQVSVPCSIKCVSIRFRNSSMLFLFFHVCIKIHPRSFWGVILDHFTPTLSSHIGFQIMDTLSKKWWVRLRSHLGILDRGLNRCDSARDPITFNATPIMARFCRDCCP